MAGEPLKFSTPWPRPLALSLKNHIPRLTRPSFRLSLDLPSPSTDLNYATQLSCHCAQSAARPTLYVHLIYRFRLVLSDPFPLFRAPSVCGDISTRSGSLFLEPSLRFVRSSFFLKRHQRNEWHVCECGKQFLDPAGRSRCRAGHSRSFGCSASECSYRFVPPNQSPRSSLICGWINTGAAARTL